MCGSCVQRDLTCLYTQTRRRPAVQSQSQARKRIGGGGDQNDLLSRLRTLPFAEATELLKSIRHDGQALSFQQSAPESSRSRTPSLPTGLPISEHDVLRSLLPSTPNGFEFELTVRHSIAFPTLIPISVTSPSMGNIVKPTLIQQLGLARTWNPQGLLTDNQLTFEPGPPLHQTHPSRQIDHRLRHVDISKWTDVPISNDLAVRVVAHYLDVDHPVLPLFDADLFLSDLVHYRSDFCSRLLVSAVIAWACVRTLLTWSSSSVVDLTKS